MKGQKIIEGFPDYFVTKCGDVISYKSGKPHTLRPGATTNGYFLVVLRNGNGPKSKYVHRLVLEAFVGPSPERMEACHNDGDKANNHLSNLRWDTHVNNHIDRIGHGTLPRGSRSGTAKLTEKQVLEIYRRAHTGEKSHDIAPQFGISSHNVRNIKTGRNWAWLTKKEA